MALSDPITLRLHVDQKRRYEDEAARRQLPLTTYLRRRLEEGAPPAGVGSLRASTRVCRIWTGETRE